MWKSDTLSMIESLLQKEAQKENPLDTSDILANYNFANIMWWVDDMQVGHVSTIRELEDVVA